MPNHHAALSCVGVGLNYRETMLFRVFLDGGFLIVHRVLLMLGGHPHVLGSADRIAHGCGDVLSHVPKQVFLAAENHTLLAIFSGDL